MATQSTASAIAPIIRKWQKKRGSLIMMLHEIQDLRGYVPRELAFELAQAANVPLARIYEVLTFYSYFKLNSPGRAVVSVCTGTACHLKGADDVVEAFGEELGITEGQTTSDGDFHLQCVRCVGCCSLAPVVVINNKTYGKVKTTEVRGLVGQWKERLEAEPAVES
jgi:NADH-quinone oxidoreductase subunit E